MAFFVDLFLVYFSLFWIKFPPIQCDQVFSITTSGCIKFSKFSNFQRFKKNFLGMSGKKFRWPFPSPCSPTILGRNINVQFACSGELYGAPPNKIRPIRPCDTTRKIRYHKEDTILQGRYDTTRKIPVAKPARQFGHAMQIFPCSYTVKTINF
jgi:hypothetical protein